MLGLDDSTLKSFVQNLFFRKVPVRLVVNSEDILEAQNNFVLITKCQILRACLQKSTKILP